MFTASRSATISNNTFVGNTAADNGSAITTGYPGYPPAGPSSGSATIQGNTLSRHSGPSTIAVSDGNPTIQQNNFVNNTAVYDLVNLNSSGTPAVDATNNWWGTTDTNAVQTRIFDFTDDIGRGVVNASPLRSGFNLAAPLTPPTGLQITAGANTLNLKWTANPESDVAGYKVYYGTTASVYAGTGATQGASPIDAGNVTSFTLTGLAPGTYYVTVTAYDNGRDGTNDQTDGNESWFATVVSVTLP